MTRTVEAGGGDIVKESEGKKGRRASGDGAKK